MLFENEPESVENSDCVRAHGFEGDRGEGEERRFGLFRTHYCFLVDRFTIL
jgi:hypothetical protein